MTLCCVGTASVFGWLLAYYQIPQTILSGVDEWGMEPIQTGFFVALVFLIVGCFLDVSLAFGLVTPPYGLCLLIACSIGGIRMTEALRDTMFMLIPMLAVLALLIVRPAQSPGPCARSLLSGRQDGVR